MTLIAGFVAVVQRLVEIVVIDTVFLCGKITAIGCVNLFAGLVGNIAVIRRRRFAARGGG